MFALLCGISPTPQIFSVYFIPNFYLCLKDEECQQDLWDRKHESRTTMHAVCSLLRVMWHFLMGTFSTYYCMVKVCPWRVFFPLQSAFNTCINSFINDIYPAGFWKLKLCTINMSFRLTLTDRFKVEFVNSRIQKMHFLMYVKNRKVWHNLFLVIFDFKYSQNLVKMNSETPQPIDQSCMWEM